jgi:hypothetical protein
MGSKSDDLELQLIWKLRLIPIQFSDLNSQQYGRAGRLLDPSFLASTTMNNPKPVVSIHHLLIVIPRTRH